MRSLQGAIPPKCCEGIPMFDPSELKVRARIGSGGAGYVFRASKGSQRYAIKMEEIEAHCDHFIRECRANSSLISQELNGNLHHSATDGCLPLAEFQLTKDIMDSVWEGLKGLHAPGILHEDIKSTNILDNSQNVRWIDLSAATTLPYYKMEKKKREERRNEELVEIAAGFAFLTQTPSEIYER
ncbi:hypothetical protein M501DRAFT_1029009 [Patellaria atrata CBS 101060]|uniref:Protein kinase domain-containing protein n=1 Tax=Patellaria atrata CBS 101060 TaxID=1346257 RepID=A0A9P4SI81_9PEZI|nr:hypothetical protein M501DRAFT_1029009 [Patellaria atrata CBS 101060]